MAQSSSPYIKNSSMLNSAITLENINQYNLDFSPEGIETDRAIGNFINNEVDRSYETHFTNLINDRNQKIRCTTIGPQPFFKSYSEIINDDRTSKELLKNNICFIAEETVLSLTQLCIDEEVNNEYLSMENISRQTMLMTHIVRLMNTTTNDTNRCIELFFHRLCSSESYRQQFNKDLQKFQDDIKDRTMEINRIIEEKEEEEKSSVAARLDSKVVMESLPEELKECFKARDPAKLQVVLFKMSTKEAADHLDRCLRSGLLRAKPKGLDNEKRTNDAEEKITGQ